MERVSEEACLTAHLLKESIQRDTGFRSGRTAPKTHENQLKKSSWLEASCPFSLRQQCMVYGSSDFIAMRRAANPTYWRRVIEVQAEEDCKELLGPSLPSNLDGVASPPVQALMG